jgi:hypothetical protein
MARKKITRTVPNTSARHLWLAGLGFASIATRQTTATATHAADRVAQARRQATTAMEQAQSNMIAAASDLRARIETGVAQLGGSLEATLSPLMAKFKPAKAKRTVRRGRPLGSKNVRRVVKKAKVAKRTRKA